MELYRIVTEAYLKLTLQLSDFACESDDIKWSHWVSQTKISRVN